MFKKSTFFFYLVFINCIQLNSQTLVFAEIQGSPIIRSEIMMHKNKILKKLRNLISNQNFLDIK